MNRPLKVGLVGAGRISHLHLPAYRDFDEVELVAVCDVNEEAARSVAAAAGLDEVYVDVLQMLERADLDAVDICSSHDQHLAHVEAAASAGKHVLVEKAMGRSLGECRSMLAATDAAGVTFMVAQNLRYGVYTPTAKALVDSGALGNVLAVRGEGAMDVRGTLSPGDWMLDGARAGGGTLITFSSHLIDLIRHLVGDVRTVTGMCRTAWDGPTNGAEDFACATLEFTNGAVGSLFSTWTSYRAPGGVSYVLYGDEGSLHTVNAPVEVPTEQMGRPFVSAGSGRGFVPIERSTLTSDSSFVNEILHFADCCRTGAAPISSGRDNLETMKVVVGVYEAARTGVAVDLTAL